MPSKMINPLLWTFVIFGAAWGQDPILSISDLPVSTLKFFYTRQDAQNEGIKDPEMIQFWRALKNTTTAPNFVLAKVASGSSVQSSIICVLAPDLLKAIEIEMGGNAEDAFQFAIKNFGQPFSFRKQASRRLIAIGYSQNDLKLAIDLISKFSNDELISGFSNGSPKFEFEILSKMASRSRQPLQLKGAIAHAISLRGLLVGRGCLGPNLGVEE